MVLLGHSFRVVSEQRDNEERTRGLRYKLSPLSAYDAGDLPMSRAVSLRARSAMPGTDIAYGAAAVSGEAQPGTISARRNQMHSTVGSVQFVPERWLLSFAFALRHSGTEGRVVLPVVVGNAMSGAGVGILLQVNSATSLRA
eukprot:2183240-Rhodomonas_salina.2